jgi:hypothetical protein
LTCVECAISKIFHFSQILIFLEIFGRPHSTSIKQQVQNSYKIPCMQYKHQAR